MGPLRLVIAAWQSSGLHMQGGLLILLLIILEPATAQGHSGEGNRVLGLLEIGEEQSEAVKVDHHVHVRAFIIIGVLGGLGDQEHVV